MAWNAGAGASGCKQDPGRAEDEPVKYGCGNQTGRTSETRQDGLGNAITDGLPVAVQTACDGAACLGHVQTQPGSLGQTGEADILKPVAPARMTLAPPGLPLPNRRISSRKNRRPSHTGKGMLPQR